MVVILLYDHTQEVVCVSATQPTDSSRKESTRMLRIEEGKRVTAGGSPIKLYRTPGVFIQFIFIVPLAFYDRCNISLFLFSLPFGFVHGLLRRPRRSFAR